MRYFGRYCYTGSKYQPIVHIQPIINGGIALTVNKRGVLITSNTNCITGFIETELDKPSKATIWYKNGKHPTDSSLDLVTQTIYVRK